MIANHGLPIPRSGVDRLTSIEVFVAVVDRGSLSAAAPVFAISTTMVGKHLRALEEHVGGRLLSRTTRRQSLTELGRAYYQRCRKVLEELRAADASAHALAGAPRGTLRVSAPVAFGAERLVPALPELLDRHPLIDVDLSLDDRVVDLVGEGFDAALRVGRLASSNLVARPLEPYRTVLCASPAYLAARGTPRVPAELAAHSCLGFTWSSRTTWRFGDGGDRVDVPVNGRLQSNSGQALRVAALHGLGVIRQSEALLAADLAAGRLVRLLEDFPLAPRPLHLVYLRDRRPTPKLRAFADFVLARFGPRRPPR
jgi:DNA-binding transcriptional LysR family regulator